MEVLITEIPGGYFEAYQCPFCGRMSPAYEVDPSTGEPVAESKVDPPRECPRCHSPMDMAKAQKFQDDMATVPAAARSAAKRRTVTV